MARKPKAQHEQTDYLYGSGLGAAATDPARAGLCLVSVCANVYKYVHKYGVRLRRRVPRVLPGSSSILEIGTHLERVRATSTKRARTAVALKKRGCFDWALGCIVYEYPTGGMAEALIIVVQVVTRES